MVQRVAPFYGNGLHGLMDRQACMLPLSRNMIVYSVQGDIHFFLVLCAWWIVVLPCFCVAGG